MMNGKSRINGAPNVDRNWILCIVIKTGTSPNEKKNAMEKERIKQTD